MNLKIKADKVTYIWSKGPMTIWFNYRETSEKGYLAGNQFWLKLSQEISFLNEPIELS